MTGDGASSCLYALNDRLRRVADVTLWAYRSHMFIKLVCATLMLTWSMPSVALCIYHGVDNAKTSIAQEFRDSDWGVRAHVVSADYHWSDTGESWTLYQLRIVKAYKGKLSTRFALFTERNSGGFYMDNDGGTPDVDRDYLLFLTPRSFSTVGASATKGALRVNYSCGQSKVWSDVTADEAAELSQLSHNR